MGLTMRRVIDREKPKEIDELFYLNPEEVARWVQPHASKGNVKKFLELIQKNDFTDMYQIFGGDGPAMQVSQTGQPPYYKLRSGRLVSCTRGWNPLVYAFLFDHVEICTYVVEHSSSFDLRQCFQVMDYFSLADGKRHQHVEEDMVYEQQRRSANLHYPYDYERHYRRNFLGLLIHNKSGSLQLVLNEFYFLWDLEDVIFMVG